MSRKLKLGVVGTGNIFRSAHLSAWLEHPEIEVVALCDVVQERAQKLADEHGIALVYTDYRELLRHGDIDAVDIYTPNLYHSEVAGGFAAEAFPARAAGSRPRSCPAAVR